MPINARPRTLGDLFRAIWDQGQTPTVPSPGQVVHAVLLTRGGVTNLGLAWGLPSVARGATWIAGGDGTTPPAPGDTSLTHETVRAPVQPILQAPGQTLALALLPIPRGNGPLREMGLFGPGSRGSPSIAAGSGTLYTHTLFAIPFLKNTSKLVTLEWAES